MTTERHCLFARAYMLVISTNLHLLVDKKNQRLKESMIVIIKCKYRLVTEKVVPTIHPWGSSYRRDDKEMKP